MSVLFALALGVACTDPARDTDDTAAPNDTTVDTATDLPAGPWSVGFLSDGSLNLLLPYEVAVDPPRRRAWVSSLIDPVIAEVDIERGRLVEVHALDLRRASLPTPESDGTGITWLVAGEGQPLVRIDGARRSVTHVDTGIPTLRHVAGLPAGGAVVTGTTRAGRPVIARVRRDGGVEARSELDGVGVAVAVNAAGTRVAALSRGEDPALAPWIDLRDATTLASVGLLPAPFVGNAVTALPDDAWAIVANTQVAVVDAAGGVVVRTVGTENKEAVALGDDTVLLLDRIGADAIGTRNAGVARRLDATLADRAGVFRTGKNSGFGGFDPVLGRAWMNSEGTTSLQAYDPTTGARVADVALGVHLESVATDETRPGIAWVSGRLSGTLARVDLVAGTVLASPEQVGWPVAPVVADGSVWVLDQLSQTLWELDPDTLVARAHHDLGLPENSQLNFDDLAWDADRGVFWVTAAQQDLLLRVGRDGTVQGTWRLPGALLSDELGVLDVAVDAAGVVVYRTQDGVLTTFDPQRTVFTTTTLAPAQVRALAFDTLPRVLALDPDRVTIWLGGTAWDRRALVPTGRVLDVDRVLSVDAAGVVGWQDGASRVVRLDAAGTEVAAAGVIVAEGTDPAAVWSPGWARAVYLDPSGARVVAVPWEAAASSR